ncbi:MAG TPA: hypothetical protein VIW80_10725 [Pyrinomonadaceae bacterium]|jgi:hypothetical protein
MSYAERTHRTLRVLLLIFALTAVVWPETKYSTRLQLRGEVSAATADAKATPYPSELFRSQAETDSAMAASLEASPLTIRYLKRQTSVYATVPTYPEALGHAADQAERVDALFEPSIYASPGISQPAGRGPPVLV